MVLAVSEVYARGYGAGRARVGSTRSQERLVVYYDSGAAVGVEKADAAKGKGLNRLLRGRVWKWSFYVGVESDFIGWRVGDPCTFLPSETTRNERSFEKERQRAAGQREWTAKHPLPRRWRGVDGEWDQLPRVSIEQHGGCGFLPTHKIPQSSPHPR